VYSGLRGVNCIYDDGTVVPLDQGPCQEVLDNGAFLVDANTSESEITVTTAPPWSGWAILAGLGALFMAIGGKRAFR